MEISQLTHPHLGKISQKKRNLFLAASLSEKQYKSQYTIDKIAVETIEVILSDSCDTGLFVCSESNIFLREQYIGRGCCCCSRQFHILFCREAVKNSFYLGKSPKCGLVGWCDPKLLKSLFLWHIILGYPPGKPIKTNSAVFFNIVQMAFDPPPRFEHVCCNFF